jgi:tetratricopeptide (TPR) repeat protein
MDIKVVSRGSNPTSTSSGSVGANGVEALVRTARQQYQLGNWASAATSFERALRAGADPGSNNQRLAQCYEKLGRNSDAVGAYNRAIEAYQSDVNSGSGDKSRLQAALDSCRQAVKVLGG